MNVFRNFLQKRRSASTSEVSSNASESDYEETLPYRKKSGYYFVGDYKIISELGHGKFATVVLAKVPGSDKQYAIKMVRLKKSREETLLGEKNILEFLRENRHKLIVKYYDTFVSNNYMCFVLEYLGGGSLAYHLRCGPVSEERARFYAACMLSAVAHLHSLNIAHKDIKPQNVVLNQHGYAILVDFGHSQLQIKQGTPLRDRLGTQRYKAPEFFGSGPIFRASDFWALCVTLYVMLTKKYVTVLPRIEYDISNLSPSAKDLFGKVFKKNPNRRLGSGGRGAKEIMDHPYFKKIDFDKLSKGSLEAPPMRPSRLQILKNLVLCQCVTS